MTYHAVDPVVAAELRRLGVVAGNIPQCGTCQRGSARGDLISCGAGVDDVALTLSNAEAKAANPIWAYRKYSVVGLMSSALGAPVSGSDCEAMAPTDGADCSQYLRREVAP